VIPMKLFYTSSVKHLADKMKIPKGKCIIKNFSDGEFYIKVEEKVANKQVWVLATTASPAENILELMFLLDALHRKKAKINLLLTYFGYARQDRTKPGEAFSSKLVSGWLKQYKLHRVVVIHMHGPRVKKFFKHENIIPIDVCYAHMKHVDVVVAPDKGSLPLAKKVSKFCKCDLVCMEKTRPSMDKAKIVKIMGNVKGKNALLVDDMIDTGGTIVAASKTLKDNGAKEVYVVVTHGILAKDAIQKIEKSPIKKVYVTNSLEQKKRSKKIKIIDLSAHLEKIMKNR